MFLDYRIMPGKAPMPVIAIGGGRVVGAPNILMALGRKTNRFLPKSNDAAPWLSDAPIDPAALDARIGTSSFVLGEFSIVDMAIYPRLAREPALTGAHPAIARWAARMALRPATGRGMGVVAK
jgi:hypothetical protein